jgi:hypothetical protein
MRLAQKTIIALITLVMLTLTATAVHAQSLAELARQQRARKQAEPKNGKVYTNADIPEATLSSPNAPAAQPAAAQKPADTATAKPGESKEKTPAELEKEYRDKFAKLREVQKFEEDKLDVMQRELNLMQIQVSSDPNVQLREDTTRETINKRTADIEAQKATVEKAKQAVADLEEELRTKGLPPGWAR